MGSMLKYAAPAEFYFVGKYKGELKYEHMLPTQWVAMALAQHYTGIKKYNLKDLQSKYKVAIIPKVYVNAFDNGVPFFDSPRLIKKATVIGIIGKTQGVNKDKKPIDRARRIKGKNPSSIAASRLILPSSSKTASL